MYFNIPKLDQSEKWGKKCIDNIRPPSCIFFLKNLVGSKKLRNFAPESVKNKYIDNIRPPKAAVSGASSAPLFSGRRPRGLRYETPSLSGWWSAQPKGVWGWTPPSGGVGAKPLPPELPK